jgi:hypothetical protein
MVCEFGKNRCAVEEVEEGHDHIFHKLIGDAFGWVRLSPRLTQTVKTLLGTTCRSMINAGAPKRQRFMLNMPVKRRRALVATIPIEE